MDYVVNPLIYTHAFLGGVALLAGSVAIVSKKGKTWHKTSGKVFFYGMLGSALLALVIAVLPNHENGFLFSIGLFSTYLLLSGYRGLQYKNQSVSLGWDKLLSTSMIVVGTAMVLGPVVWQGAANIVLAVFGGLAVLFGVRDLRMFTNPEILRKNWLKIHLGKMTGAYIASVSAFLVVNQFFHPLLNWFLPTILGSVFITYWMVRIKKGLPSRKTT
jgi:uncharacterized membrane protein